MRRAKTSTRPASATDRRRGFMLNSSRCFVRVFLIAALLHGQAVTAFPQQSPAKPVQSESADQGPVVRITTSLVQLDAVVTDKDGRHVTDLKPEDFAPARRREGADDHALFLRVREVVGRGPRARRERSSDKERQGRGCPAASPARRHQARTGAAHDCARGRRSGLFVREHELRPAGAAEIRGRADAAGRPGRRPALQRRVRRAATVHAGQAIAARGD